MAKFDRRTFFRKGSASVIGGATAGAVGIAASQGSADELPSPVRGVSLGVVTDVRSDGALEIERRPDSRSVDLDDPQAAAAELGPDVLAQPPASTIVQNDPSPQEDWREGQTVALLEAFDETGWRIVDLERLYVPFNGVTVSGVSAGGLTTYGGLELSFGEETESRADPGDEYDAVPPDQISTDDVVGGLGFADPDAESLGVAQIATQRGA